VFENRLLRRIFAPKRDQITGGWTKLHNEDLHNLIIRMIKSRRKRRAGCVAHMGKEKSAYEVLEGNLKERNN
jgi:hypothetical protein